MDRPLAGVKLRLAVADDPALAAAIVRVRGEWNVQTGAEFEVIETSEKDLTRADALPADAVLCASHLLGVLAERKVLAPVPKKILRDAEWAGIFELLKLREVAWGDQVMAVPFGSPVFCCYYRADLLEKLGRRGPQTWAEYQDLAKLLVAQPPSAVGGDSSRRLHDVGGDSSRRLHEESTQNRRLESPPTKHKGREGVVCHHRAAGPRLGRIGPPGPRSPLRKAPRQLLGAVRHRDDGAVGGRSADGPSP